MISINQNNAIKQLTDIVEQSLQNKLQYMSEEFNNEQLHAIELLKQRVYLEEVVEESIAFNKRVAWDNTFPNLKLVDSAEDLISVFQLRSSVYTNINYIMAFIKSG